MPHVAPGIIRPTETHVLEVIIYSLSSKSQQMPKDMVLMRGMTPPPFIVNLVAPVHYKPKEN